MSKNGRHDVSFALVHTVEKQKRPERILHSFSRLVSFRCCPLFVWNWKKIRIVHNPIMIIIYTLLLVFLPSSQATPAPHRHHNLDTDVDMELQPRLPYRNRASSLTDSEQPSRTSSLRGQWFELPTVPAFMPPLHTGHTHDDEDEDDYDWNSGESSGSAGTESLTSTVLSLTEEYDTYEEGPLDGHKDHLVNGSSAVNSLWFVSLIVSMVVAMLLHY